MSVKENWGLGCVVLVFMAGCTTQYVEFDRWHTIHEGAPIKYARKALGKPGSRGDGVWSWRESDRGITAEVYHSDGRVTGKRWIDPQRGEVRTGAAPESPPADQEPQSDGGEERP